MILTYDLALEDISAFGRYHITHSPNFRVSKFAGIIVLWLIFISASLVIDPEPFGRTNLVAGTVIFVSIASLLFGTLVNRLYEFQITQLYRRKENRKYLCSQEIEIDNTGLLHRTAFSETRLSWNGVVKIVDTDKYIFIYISSFMGYVIPKRSVTRGDSNCFVSSSMQLWHDANPEQLG